VFTYLSQKKAGELLESTTNEPNPVDKFIAVKTSYWFVAL